MSLGNFVSFLEDRSEVVRVTQKVSTYLELTEIQRRIVKSGPAVIFENVEASNMERYKLPNKNYPNIPIICNLFGTTKRVALGLGLNEVDELRQFGEQLASLQQPKVPQNLSEAKNMLPLVKRLLSMRPKVGTKAACQEKIFTGDDVDIGMLPIQSCWEDEPAPLITWSVCVTQGKGSDGSYNLGVYRMQVLSHNKLIVRWLKHRGGAEHYRTWQKSATGKMPVAVVIGCDPATLLAAVMPIPESISEYNFSGLLRKKRLSLVKCRTNSILVPSDAEIVLEGWIDLNEMADEGPYGDHTGFYNAVEKFPVMTVTAITMRNNPLYLTTFTGRPPDEPSVLGEALNEVFVPLLKKQFPEIVDFWLPPEACSYRIAVVSIVKSYPGHAKRIMMGIWSFLKQFSYTKFIIVVDAKINVKSWVDVMWAISTQMDFGRDVLQCNNTPIDYLDFASNEVELGTKMGFDATTKIYPETKNVWGREIVQNTTIIEQVSQRWGNTKLFK